MNKKRLKILSACILSLLLSIAFFIELYAWGGGHPVHPNSDFWISSNLKYKIANIIGLMLGLAPFITFIASKEKVKVKFYLLMLIVSFLWFIYIFIIQTPGCEKIV